MVDDTSDNLVVLRGFLEQAGHKQLQAAASAKEAYQILGLDSPSQQPCVDLILMDISMPDINGMAACQKIKADPRYQDVPVIMVTAHTDLTSLADAFSAGAMDYIVKPVRKIELLTRVQSALKLKFEMDCRKAREAELKKKNEELEKAAEEIKLLQGFIPVCAYCKKIRDMKGMWQQMEAYLQRHTGLQFSHGICAACLKKEYGKIYDPKSGLKNAA